jgi:hypothetical protein
MLRNSNRGVARNRAPPQLRPLRRDAGHGIIWARRTSSTHLHRPWRANIINHSGNFFMSVFNICPISPRPHLTAGPVAAVVADCAPLAAVVADCAPLKVSRGMTPEGGEIVSERAPPDGRDAVLGRAALFRYLERNNRGRRPSILPLSGAFESIRLGRLGR